MGPGRPGPNLYNDMNTTDISIIVPVKNDVQYIEVSIKSIMAQYTTLNFEILLVDDGSTDGSIQLACALLDHNVKKIPYKVLELNDTTGVAAARNLGVLNANSEYILFVDADDMLISGAIDALWNTAKTKDFDMVIGRTKVMGKQAPTDTAVGKVFDGDEYLLAYMSGMGDTECWNKLIKKSFLLEHNILFDQSLQAKEGELWNFRMALCKPRVGTTTGYTYVYRDSRVGTVRDMDSQDYLRLSLFLLKREIDIMHSECQEDYITATAKYLSGIIRGIMYDVVHTRRDEQFLLEVASILSDRSVRKLFELFIDSKDKFTANMREIMAPSLRYFRKRKLFRLLRSQHDEVMNKAFQRVLL